MVELTAVTVISRLVVVTGGNITVVAEPSLFSDGTVTVVPSLNLSVAPVIRSSVFGRS